MKENENKKSVVRVTEGNPSATADVLQDGTQNNKEKLKKPLIFGLMAIVFVVVCTSYLNHPKTKRQLKM